MSDEKFKIPQSEIDSLARMLLPKIQEYFSTEKGGENMSSGNSKK